MIVLLAIRTAVFYLLYFGQTVILALVLGTQSKLVRGKSDFGWGVAQYWVRSNVWLLRWVAGIRTDVRGAENIPDGPCIIASKHMSDWDIFALLPDSKKPAFIAKKELIDIPFFGWAAQTFDTIRIDRSKGGDAIPLMLSDARAALDRGCRIIIFPEGTRKAPLAVPDYKYGIVRMYEELHVPVVPVALDSGLYWGRRSLLLRPGTARARFLPAIDPGLSGEAFFAALQESIETGSDALLLDAIAHGHGHGLTPQQQTRLESLKATR
ncbi:MAG TPA: lysophospholipid acyltransferase family protein [Devosia sp.]|nr:lysophospholipid acyltransferase family protein [Devosia sp.]